MHHKLIIEVPEDAHIDPDDRTITLPAGDAHRWAQSVIDVTAPPRPDDVRRSPREVWNGPTGNA